MVNRPPSADPAGPSERDGAYNVRSVPVRLYLPDGPVMQGLVPPMMDDSGFFVTSLSYPILTCSSKLLLGHFRTI